MVRVVVLALALIACGHSPNPPKPRAFRGERVPTQCAHDKETETEECRGWWMDRLMVFFGQRHYGDPAVARYVTAVGNRLARAAGERRPWKFRVLDDASVQAFVIAGSVVYIHRGTLAVLRSEAELAAVLAHEMGHLRGGHSKAKSDDRAETSRSEPEKSMQQKWERDDEIQADETAVLLLGRAGYDPHAVEAMLRAIAGTMGEGAEQRPDDVHPWWPERIARAQAITSRGGELGVESYRKGVASLIVGADPRRIQLQGHAIVFASARAALDLPAFDNPVVDEESLTIRLSDGGKARLVTVNADLAKLLGAMAEDDKRVLEIHHKRGEREAIAISVTGTPNAASMARAMRGAMRDPRPAELARLSPTRVDLTAPRRIWR